MGVERSALSVTVLKGFFFNLIRYFNYSIKNYCLNFLKNLIIIFTNKITMLNY